MCLPVFMGGKDNMVEDTKKKVDSHTKQVIIDRLHDSLSVCVCGKRDCKGETRSLPKFLEVNAVLRAINVDEFFFKENDQ